MRRTTLRLLAAAALLVACTPEAPDAGAEAGGASDDDVGFVREALTTTTINNVADIDTATIYEEATTENGGAYTEICIGNVGSNLRYGYVRFDLSAIPSNRTVTRVQLTFRQERVRFQDAAFNVITPKTATLAVREVTSAWTEGTDGDGVAACAPGATANAGGGVTWGANPDTSPSVAGANSATVALGNSPGGNTVDPPVSYTIDTDTGTANDELINDVQGWISGGTNHGWRIGVTQTGTTDNARLITAVSLVVTYGLSNGQSCSLGTQCASDNCVGSVCCNSACAGECQTCGTGTCTNLNSGNCGAGPSCSGGVALLQMQCNGGSGCPAQTMVSCAPYVCDGTACGTTCSDDGDCASGNFCNAGTCEAKRAQGATCSANSWCSNDRCVDGRCCNTTCTGQCEACDNASGICGARTGAPLGGRPACTDTDADGCDGTCNGTLTSACTYPTSSCRAQSCSGSTLTLPASCSVGDCPAVSTSSCSPYACDGGGTACRTTCSSNTHCATGFWCSGGSCVAEQANGASCSDGFECTSGNCVDGYCCNAACTGQCEACDVSGNLGTCSQVSGAPHGSRSACAAASAPCAGTCGTSRTACDYPGMATECRAASCTAGTETQQAFCQGDGSCGALVENDCTPYTCDGDACGAGSCANDGECAGGYFCNASMTCQSVLALGVACDRDAMCSSGMCVDGVCCGSLCVGQCEACNVGGSLGTCTGVTGAPVGGRPACSGSGACAGACDGASSSCVYPADETTCAAASCAAGVYTEAASCLGDGTCGTGLTVDCSPYGCSGATCATSCSATVDCDVGYWCNGSSRCVPVLDDGASCSADEQCLNSHCTDGVCCDASCDGQCEACNLGGSVGVCSPVTGAPVGSRTACADSGEGCGGACDGSSRTACAYPASETSCRDQSCAGETRTEAATCDGAGACGALDTTDCSPYVCADATDCRTACTSASDCVDGAFCNGSGLCEGTRVLGEACTTNGQCVGGFCADGVCCDRACDGQCEACSASGLCGAVTGDPVGSRPACTDDGSVCGGTCDGSTTATCTYPSASTSCRAASCADGVGTLAATCDGAGSCPAVVTDECSPYFCAGTACGTSCAADGDCVATSFCDETTSQCFGALTAGTACTADNECASAHCADGVCCDTACDGQCEACNVPGRAGTCSGVLGLPRNGRAACDTDGTVCGGLCDGETTATCTYPGSETECRPASCVSRRATQSASCGGDGTCPDEVVVDCEANCDGDVCGTPRVDSGPPEEDAGTAESDASVDFDAGLVDAGDGEVMDGGCSCRAAQPRRGGAGLAVLGLLGIAVLVRRRRR